MVGLNAKVRELPVLLGRQASLVGILAEASQAAQVKDAPVIVLLNAGIVHRVGPNRMYVLLARALAAAGYMSLRFDLSGIGDSPNRVDALPPLESALSDIREAVDWMAANKQACKVILVGLCAGADHSVLYASSDRRVVGMVLLDPSIPRTKRFHLNEFRRRLSSLVKKGLAQALGSITNVLKGILPLHDDIGTNESEPVERRLDDDELRGMFESHYRQSVLSDVKLLALITGGLPGQHNYREQLIDAFPDVPFGDRLTLEYLPQSDHSFTSESNRELLKQSVLRWLQTTSFTEAGLQLNAGEAATAPSCTTTRSH
jgi:pimeloyl-ACP methyl ester carboxylesterase